MDWSNPIGSAVSGGFGVIGSALNYYFNKKLQQQQNEYNLNMWNLQNEYNSPQAQMKRYEDAGLNPALMYGQVTPGNATQAPHMGVPDAPNISEDMRALSQAFNIEGLKTAIANRKEQQAKAKLASVAAANASDERAAQHDLGVLYSFDPESGRYVFTDPQVEVAAPMNKRLRKLTFETGAPENRQYYFMRMLSDNFRTNSLLVPRANLIGSQMYLNRVRQGVLAPQIRMNQYSSKYYPVQYWIGNAKNGVQTIAPFVPLLP